MGAFFPVVPKSSEVNGVELQEAYAKAYSAVDNRTREVLRDEKPVLTEKRKAWYAEYKKSDSDSEDEEQQVAFKKLADAQKAWNEQGLNRNAATMRDDQEASKTAAHEWLQARITQLTADIDLLQRQLQTDSASTQAGSTKVLSLPVMNADGIVIRDDEIAVKPGMCNGQFLFLGEKLAESVNRIHRKKDHL
jgi:hypothetical protein